MPRLTELRRWRSRRRARDDRGGAATIVAILLAGGVLLGMTALVVDVGQLYAEREELQSGADSAAFAIALDCALDREACDDHDLTALRYAQDNARDGLADVTVCGSDPLPACTTGAVGNLTDCLNERPDNGIAFVEVRTTTRTSDGTLLPPSFAQTLVAGYEGTTVGACARVAYGSPAGGLAVTLSECEWEGATEGGDRYPPADATPSEFLDYEVIVYTHDSHGQAECFNKPPHDDGNGGFGWLMGDDCRVTIVDNTYRSDQGNNADHPCRDELPLLRESGTPVPIPIYDMVTHTPPGLTYRLVRIEMFVVTGYRATGSVSAPSNLPGSALSCSGSDRCIIGYFLEPGVIDWGGEIGDPLVAGPVVVRTVG